MLSVKDFPFPKCLNKERENAASGKSDIKKWRKGILFII